MSGLQNFLTPYSHLLFGHRDTVIVVLAFVLGWFVIWLMVARWRTERLERDLAAARATASHAPSRARHVAPPVVEEAPAEAGGLPPIKGGRSYARNLGSALQKAGIPSGPQLYSPPVPQGWNPNTGNGQPNPVAPPMQPPTYAPPPAQWGAPPAPAAPWAYPAGANRPPFQNQPMGPPPSPYAPTAPGPFSANLGQPLPAGYPPPAPAQFSQPFQAAAPGPDDRRQVTEASNSAAPPVAPPPPSAPPVAQGVPTPPPAMQAEESGSKDGRRGKPKRRRFNLSVLDNLEKIVQPKTPEPQPAAGVARVAEPVIPIVVPVPAPAPAPVPAPMAAMPPVVETPSLFDQPETRSEPEAAPLTETAEPEAAEDEVVAQEPEPIVVAEAPRSSRPEMRSMLFGEEPTPEAEPVPPAEASEVTEDAVATEAPEVVEAEAPREPEPIAEVVPPSEPEAAATADWSAATEASNEWPYGQRATDPEPEAPVEAVVEGPVEAAVVEPEPMLAEPEPVAAEPPVEPAPTTGGAGVLVIIEDDKAAADYYATLFRGNGYQVDIANDGVSGVDLCVRLQPQVILLDVMMPRQNGILVLQTLRASDETRNTPVVVMSNFSEPTLIKRALQLGALEYVIKTQVEGPALLTAMPHWMNREKAFAA